MKNLIRQVAISIGLGGSLLSGTASALAPGGGGGVIGGNCATCSCTVTGSIGNQTCSCPRATVGGINCTITYTPGWGNTCSLAFGPCQPVNAGFGP